MPERTFIEVPNKGLFNKLDPALMPEGALAVTQNARYRPGDPALWIAEGREQVTDGGGAEHGNPVGIDSIAGMSWDPGSLESTGPDVANLRQILYVFGGAALKTIPARDDPDDADMVPTNALTWAYSGYTPGSKRVQVINYREKNYVLTGGDNGVMERDDSGQSFTYWGVPANTVPPSQIVPSAAGVGSEALTFAAPAIQSAGSGYLIGDELTVTDANALSPTILTVKTVDGSGGVTGVAITATGVTTSAPSNPVSVTGGSGDDLATFNLNYTALDTEFVAPGWHAFWFTFLKKDGDDVVWESDATSDAVRHIKVTSETWTSMIPIFDDAAWLAMEALIPTDYTHVRLYKSDPVDTELVDKGEARVSSGYPIGWGYADVPKADITFINTGSYSGNYSFGPWPDGGESTWVGDDEGLQGFPIFDIVVVRVAGEETAGVGKKGQPPSASTGDVFEESVVVNDVDNVGTVRWSWPGEPDWFPESFVMRPETSSTDEVTNIKTLGQHMGVFTKTALWRVNWLPSASDFDFSRGRVMDLVTGEKGAINEASVVKFDWPGVGPALAFVDRTGIYATDLFRIKRLSEQVDLGTIESTCILLNNPDEERLEFYNNDTIYYVHYDETHRVDDSGALAVTGPITRPGGIDAAGSIVTDSGNTISVTTDIGTHSNPLALWALYYEGRGSTDEASSSSLSVNIQSRDIYPLGLANEGRASALFVHSRVDGTGSGGANVVFNGITSNGINAQAGDSLDLTQRKLQIDGINEHFEGFRFDVEGSITAAQIGFNAWGIKYESFGPSEVRD